MGGEGEAAMGETDERRSPGTVSAIFRAGQSGARATTSDFARQSHGRRAIPVRLLRSGVARGAPPRRYRFCTRGRAPARKSAIGCRDSRSRRTTSSATAAAPRSLKCVSSATPCG